MSHCFCQTTQHLLHPLALVTLSTVNLKLQAAITAARTTNAVLTKHVNTLNTVLTTWSGNYFAFLHKTDLFSFTVLQQILRIHLLS